ncbi:hypothetical protein Mapa_017663 [Marchantia paleacea]|nr:hypothetical protein Mapa_017663 [Marchantia paleacea]
MTLVCQIYRSVSGSVATGKQRMQSSIFSENSHMGMRGVKASEFERGGTSEHSL